MAGPKKGGLYNTMLKFFPTIVYLSAFRALNGVIV